MGWDESRVRVEFGKGMSTVQYEQDGAIRFTLDTCELAEIWPVVDGKAKRGKPAVTLQGETRSQLLRDLAQWIDENGDPSLSGLIEHVAAAKAVAS